MADVPHGRFVADDRGNEQIRVIVGEVDVSDVVSDHLGSDDGVHFDRGVVKKADSAFLVTEDHALCALIDDAQKHIPLHTVGGVLKGHQLGPGRKIVGLGRGAAHHILPESNVLVFLFFNGLAEGRSDAA